ncbi:MAG TPA: transglycosylase SLT domain-containing protein [Burkholderiales bacterium]|nr:transglycosylase SLT domain-containing protein [Burkholderiales bacterium]
MKALRPLLAVLFLTACASAPEAPERVAVSAPDPIPPATNEAPPPAAPTPKPASPPPFAAEPHEIRQRRTDLTQIDRTAKVDDVWQRIRYGFAMPDLDNALVREKTRYYAARPDYLQRIFDRSRLYLYHIVEEIEKRGLPTELALLPMVESAFNPMAYSRAHASGLWQFIPGTGRRFELEQNWWYDGRRDIVESTTAALDYLEKLYEMHGDWQLALASYNWGENAVARAIAKNRAAGKPTDYASLPMPAETRHYIPKLQALKNIINNPEPLGIDIGPIPNQPYFATVTKLRDIDVQLAARLAEMPVAEFIALNPGFSRPYIRASVTPRIVLPADKVDVFHDNLEALGEKSLVSWKTYHPTQGETFESIAKKHSMAVGQLKEVNGIPPRTKGVPRLLVVPTSATASTKMPIMYAPPIPVSTRRIFHTVKKGETLASIAAQHKVSAEDLKRWNSVSQAVAGRTLAVEVRAAPTKVKGKSRPKAKPRKRTT